jgi:hypothetical protein
MSGVYMSGDSDSFFLFLMVIVTLFDSNHTPTPSPRAGGDTSPAERIKLYNR